jgi:hypothetical protein
MYKVNKVGVFVQIKIHPFPGLSWGKNMGLPIGSYCRGRVAVGILIGSIVHHKSNSWLFKYIGILAGGDGGGQNKGAAIHAGGKGHQAGVRAIWAAGGHYSQELRFQEITYVIHFSKSVHHRDTSPK